MSNFENKTTADLLIKYDTLQNIILNNISTWNGDQNLILTGDMANTFTLQQRKKLATKIVRDAYHLHKEIEKRLEENG